jgi:hypothetical protein
MGQKMGTPQRLKKETWSPVKYDVEDLNTRIESGMLDKISSEAQEPKQESEMQVSEDLHLNDPCAVTNGRADNAHKAECLKTGRGELNGLKGKDVNVPQKVTHYNSPNTGNNDKPTNEGASQAQTSWPNNLTPPITANMTSSLGSNHGSSLAQKSDPCKITDAECLKNGRGTLEGVKGKDVNVPTATPYYNAPNVAAQKDKADPCKATDLECLKVGRGHTNDLNNPTVAAQKSDPCSITNSGADNAHKAECLKTGRGATNGVVGKDVNVP